MMTEIWAGRDAEGLPPRPRRRARTRVRSDFGRWLATAVAQLEEHLTYKDLAELAGMSYSYLIQIKNGHETPSATVIARLEEIVGRQFVPGPLVPGLEGSNKKLDLARDCCLVVVMGELETDTPFVFRQEYCIGQEPVLRSQNPNQNRYFLMAQDEGMAPMIPRGARCLIDPEVIYPEGAGQCYAVSLEGGAARIYLVSPGHSGYLVRALNPESRFGRAHPRGRQVGTSDLRIYGRVVAVRYTLGERGEKALAPS